MHLRFFSQDDSGVVLDELFSINLNVKDFYEFSEKIKGSGIAIRRPLIKNQGFFAIEGADWAGSSEVIIKSKEKNGDLCFTINKKDLAILFNYTEIDGLSAGGIYEIKKLVEEGIKILVAS